MAFSEVGSGTQRTALVGSNVDSQASDSVTITAGNLLIAAGAVWQTGAGVSSVALTDTRSTSWTTLLGPAVTDGAGGTYKPFIGYGIAPTSGACVVTADPSGTGCYINARVDEFASAGDTLSLDVDGGSSTGTGNTSVEDALTTLTAGALIIAVLSNGASSVMAPPGGYTQFGEDETGGIAPFNVAFLVSTTAGGYTATFTKASPAAWAVQTAAFKAVAGAGPTGPRPGSLLLLGVGR